PSSLCWRRLMSLNKNGLWASALAQDLHLRAYCSIMKNRSSKKELLDLGPDYYSQEEYRECLEKLATINRLLGIRRDSLKVIRRVKPTSILDVGCGGGHFLAQVASLYPEISCRGIDISGEAIQQANQKARKNLHFAQTCTLTHADLIFATL